MTIEEAYIREATLRFINNGDRSQDTPNPAVDACVGFCIAHEVLGEEEEEKV